MVGADCVGVWEMAPELPWMEIAVLKLPWLEIALPVYSAGMEETKLGMVETSGMTLRAEMGSEMVP